MSQALQIDAAPPRAVAQPAVATRKKRWMALDLFRFCAVCLMVQGHVFSTLLDSVTKGQSWYPHHSFVHGYTAPMFMFGAGLAFGYTTFKKWDDHASLGAPARKRFMRYFWLLFIGYLLHMPTLSLARLLQIDDPARIARMFQTDVLQHIGVSLAICQLLVFVVKRKKAFIWIVGALGSVAVLAAPWVWGWDLSSLPTPLAAYINASTGSTFPLLPWAGFTYAGIVIAYGLSLDGRGGLAEPPPGRDTAHQVRLAHLGQASGAGIQDISRRAAWPFTALALGLMVVPIVVDRFGPYPLPSHNFWKVNPLFFFWRLGNVVALLAVLCHLERLGSWIAAVRGTGGWTETLKSWVKVVAAESLIVYVVHLVVLHGSVIAPGLKHGTVVHEHSHDLFEASVVAGLLLMAMFLLAKVWNELKKQPSAFRIVQGAMLALLGYLMLAG
ncbi:MAG: heparan-alpha-glucosaminide N-acetyltransferase domain-containing protein [Sandaracinaceae bacterium]